MNMASLFFKCFGSVFKRRAELPFKEAMLKPTGHSLEQDFENLLKLRLLHLHPTVYVDVWHMV